METIKSLTFRRILIFLESVLLLVSFLSCSNKLTKEETIVVEKYTKQEKHDSAIYGRWMNPEIWIDHGKENKLSISFDDKGIQSERMYRDGKPFNNWHFIYYYYTKQGKVFLYRPAEKCFLAMDNELFSEIDYKVSEDGKTLIFGDKTYERMN